MNQPIEYNVNLEVIHPLHIGGEQEDKLIQGIDFIYNIDTREIETFSIKKHVTSELVLAETMQWIEKSDSVLENLSIPDKKIKIGFDPGSEINSFIKSKGLPYIPGSSLKGSIITVLWNSFSKGKLKSLDKKKFYNDFEDEFGSLYKRNLLARFIEVSDSSFFKKFDFVRAKTFNPSFLKDNKPKAHWKYNVRSGNNEHEFKKGFIQTFECLNSGQKAIFHLSIKEDILLFLDAHNQIKPIPKYRSKLNDKFDLEFCFMANSFIKEYMEKEKNYFSECYKNLSQSEYTGTVQSIEASLYAAIDSIRKEVTECRNNQCLIRLGMGTGFHSLSGDNYYENHFNKNGKPHFYKSRKFFFRKTSYGLNLYFPGFVKLTFEQIKN
jgi:CRISPR type III-A-associated RAMP protein Csm5